MPRSESVKVLLGKQIEALRKVRGVGSQEQLAERVTEILRRTDPEANVSRSEAQRWESGEEAPEFDELVALGEVLDVSMSSLFMEEGANPMADGLELAADKMSQAVQAIREKANTLRLPAKVPFHPPAGEKNSDAVGDGG